ncbi:MAG: glycerate kinase [Candidatus Limnocylindria bacterium]
MSPSLRVVIAPDSFGGALDSVAAAEAMARGWASARPDDQLMRIPMADGGEGTLAAIAAAQGEAATRNGVMVTDPLGRQIEADWLALDDGKAAFVEMAAASGLARLAFAERTPASARVATTRGTGRLITAALDAGAERIVIGLGGSATTDGGAGLLVEVGLRLLDARGEDVSDGGAALAEVDHIDADGLDPRLAEVGIVIASDVGNPLTGPNGAAATYGPQKGADAKAIAELDAALVRWGAEIRRATGREVADVRGAGAAGGTTAGLLGFTAAELRSGVEIVAELVGLASACVGADLVITGEGRADEQTLAGKAALGVALHAGSAPVVLLCGGLGPGAEIVEESGAFALVQPIVDRPLGLESAMADTERLLANAAARLARGIGIGLGLGGRG